MMASVKLENDDVRGAVRLLFSDDRLVIPDESTFNKLRCLQRVTLNSPCIYSVVFEWIVGGSRRSTATTATTFEESVSRLTGDFQ